MDKEKCQQQSIKINVILAEKLTIIKTLIDKHQSTFFYLQKFTNIALFTGHKEQKFLSSLHRK